MNAPAFIAAILGDDHRTISQYCDAVSVLFADVVGFTPVSTRLTPAELVELLNDVFSSFDSLVERFDVEKIKTMGDRYMIATGHHCDERTTP